MKKRITDKLRQSTGASISFALLIFLVCAVVCSVVLTAATTASGRMSKTAEYDQRYYSVTSAAELLKDLMSGNASIVQVQTGTATTTYTDGTPGTPVHNDDTVLTTYLVEDTAPASITETDLTESNKIDPESLSTVQTKSIKNDAAWRCFSGTAALSRTLNLTSAAGTSEGQDSPLDVTITEDMDENGNITFTLKNTNGDSYTLSLKFLCSKNVTTGTSSEEGSPEQISEAEDGTVTYTITTTETVTQITTYKWELAEMKTISADA